MAGHSLRLGLVSVLVVGTLLTGGGGLSYDYYKDSCPNVESIVRNAVLSIFATDPRAPSGFLRLMFHDCQVQGCDASILLDSDGRTIASEMVSTRNFGIRNRESIGQIKSMLELVCPGRVSCADVIALAARDSVAYTGGPQISIPLGRKDSTTSSNRLADAYIPSASIGVDGLLRMFMSKGMTIEESVAILGSHTIGVGHCINIVNRLYNPYRRHDQENMDYGFQMLLRLKCPTQVPLTNDTFIVNDLTTLLFDNQYYKDVMNGRGLFTVDSAISTDPRTAPIAMRFAEDQGYFFRVFSTAFVKLSVVGVLTGDGDGQVRRECNRVN